jgi:integrase
MLDELQRRNYSQSAGRSYIFAVEDFAKYFHRSPDRLGPEHIRQHQAHLFRGRELSLGTIEGRAAVRRFLSVKTLRRPYLPDDIPFPKRQRRLPTILDQQEVARLIDSAGSLMHRTMLMMLYATGLRRAEMCHLKVSDIDSKRMVKRAPLLTLPPLRTGHESSPSADDRIGCELAAMLVRTQGNDSPLFMLV